MCSDSVHTYSIVFHVHFLTCKVSLYCRYDGDVVNEYEKDNATHVIAGNSQVIHYFVVCVCVCMHTCMCMLNVVFLLSVFSTGQPSTHETRMDLGLTEIRAIAGRIRLQFKFLDISHF